MYYRKAFAAVLVVIAFTFHSFSQKIQFPDTLLARLPEMVFVKGGTFMMGSGFGGSNERPVHIVRLDDFYIGRYEITQEQYRDVMGVGITENYFPSCDSCPVERVSWYNVMEYLKELNARSVLIFRLPTEAEWEYAARGGVLSKNYRYSGGNDIDSVAWKDGNANRRTHPVGTKMPNELGIYDMTGNVWEWCSDYCSPGYYSVSPPDNPKGPAEGIYHVIRGGSWFHDSNGLRPTARDCGIPSWYYGYVGFRIVRDP